MPDENGPAASATAGTRRLPVSDSDEVVPYAQLTGAAPVRLLEQAVRRALRWYLWPLATEMSRHNRAVSAVLARHRHHLTWLRQESERLHRDIDLIGPRQDGSPPG